MKNYLKLISTFLILLVLYACPEHPKEVDSGFEIFNNSGDTIFFSFKYAEREDTSLLTLPFGMTIEHTGYKINPRQSTKVDGPFIRYFKELPEELLMLFLFDRDTLALKPWETIVAEYNILRRYDFNLDSFENRNWEIIYP